jgi:hypothetical protein
MTFTFLMTLPFALVDFFGLNQTLWKKKSYRLCGLLLFVVPGIPLQMSGKTLKDWVT